jgi:hypothetical protein
MVNIKLPQLGLSKATQQAIFSPIYVDFVANSQLLEHQIRLDIHKTINTEK